MCEWVNVRMCKYANVWMCEYENVRMPVMLVKYVDRICEQLKSPRAASPCLPRETPKNKTRQCIHLALPGFSFKL
jgi:hypothetical protein